MMDDVKVTTGEPGANDVVFDCENCGRTLCIDRVASGFSVTCPHCGTEQRVPGEQMEFAPVGEETVADDNVEGDLSENEELDQLRLRNERLENALAVQHGRLEQISREMALIQAAIDRIVGVLQDAQATPEDE